MWMPLSYAVGLELCQFFSITDGRFDLLDIGAFVLGYLLASSFALDIPRKYRLGLNRQSLFLFSGYAILNLANVF